MSAGSIQDLYKTWVDREHKTDREKPGKNTSKRMKLTNPLLQPKLLSCLIHAAAVTIVFKSALLACSPIHVTRYAAPYLSNGAWHQSTSSGKLDSTGVYSELSTHENFLYPNDGSEPMQKKLADANWLAGQSYVRNAAVNNACFYVVASKQLLSGTYYSIGLGDGTGAGNEDEDEDEDGAPPTIEGADGSITYLTEEVADCIKELLEQASREGEVVVDIETRGGDCDVVIVTASGNAYWANVEQRVADYLSQSQKDGKKLWEIALDPDGTGFVARGEGFMEWESLSGDMEDSLQSLIDNGQVDLIDTIEIDLSDEAGGSWLIVYNGYEVLHSGMDSQLLDKILQTDIETGEKVIEVSTTKDGGFAALWNTDRFWTNQIPSEIGTALLTAVSEGQKLKALEFPIDGGGILACVPSSSTITTPTATLTTFSTHSAAKKSAQRKKLKKMKRKIRSEKRKGKLSAVKKLRKKLRITKRLLRLG